MLIMLQSWLHLRWHRSVPPQRWLMRGVLVLCSALLVLGALGASPALAGIDDDHYDGSIFPLYASNGALVPPKTDLATSLQKRRPAPSDVLCG